MIDDLGVYRDGLFALQAVKELEIAEKQESWRFSLMHPACNNLEQPQVHLIGKRARCFASQSPDRSSHLNIGRD